MSVSEIDILQTEQIEALQDDVKELRDKLNLIVTDITHATNGITKKLNDAINELKKGGDYNYDIFEYLDLDRHRELDPKNNPF